MANMLVALRSLYGSWDWVLEDLWCSGHLEDIQILQEDDVGVWVFARRKHTCICVRPRNPSKRGSRWALPHLERDPKGTEKRVDVWSCRTISKSQPSLTCIIVLGHCWMGTLLLLAHHSRGAKGLKPQMMMSSQGDEDISKLKVDVGLGMLSEGVKTLYRMRPSSSKEHLPYLQPHCPPEEDSVPEVWERLQPGQPCMRIWDILCALCMMFPCNSACFLNTFLSSCRERSCTMNDPNEVHLWAPSPSLAEWSEQQMRTSTKLPSHNKPCWWIFPSSTFCVGFSHVAWPGAQKQDGLNAA